VLGFVKGKVLCVALACGLLVHDCAVERFWGFR
jgi:hypothetical protein